MSGLALHASFSVTDKVSESEERGVAAACFATNPARDASKCTRASALVFDFKFGALASEAVARARPG
eukprot:3820120-Rhodomonas_salina.1